MIELKHEILKVLLDGKYHGERELIDGDGVDARVRLRTALNEMERDGLVEHTDEHDFSRLFGWGLVATTNPDEWEHMADENGRPPIWIAVRWFADAVQKLYRQDLHDAFAKAKAAKVTAKD